MQSRDRTEMITSSLSSSINLEKRIKNCDFNEYNPFFMEEKKKICAKTCYIFKKRLILQQEL